MLILNEFTFKIKSDNNKRKLPIAYMPILKHMFHLPHNQFQDRRKLDYQKQHQFQPYDTLVYCFY